MQEWQEKIEQEVGQLREEVRQLREQKTEEIKAVRVDVASEDVTKKLDTIGQTLEQHTTMLQEISKGLLMHSRNISTLQTDVAALPTKEDIEALLIKYLRPSGNGH